MTFAEELTEVVRKARREESDRKRQAQKWLEHEGKLLDEAVEAFKRRCMRAAEEEKSDASVSFEVLSRDITDFPSRLASDSTFLVDNWGEGAAAWWYYAHRGTSTPYTPGTKVFFAELLESMMPKFVEKVHALGFQKCARIPGTWKVQASWSTPGSEPPEKKSRTEAVEASPAAERPGAPTLRVSQRWVRGPGGDVVGELAATLARATGVASGLPARPRQMAERPKAAGINICVQCG
eukprot:CAMPEP_0176207558 /NCGR_PEP_ID=MMETSP0121_2-20121125/12674_1 /TAXON_ID=160619 /ORGANISM="Kryptoperidinium foliaceum, Strain CCMP 1326" /LENGTH=236 /DNA_ID=CAMNT_0017546531 /DNA_START=35 /DNA_END=743 /DNA_ORIENTATION=+